VNVKHRLYLAAGVLLASGLYLTGLDWRPVLAEVRWRSNVERVEGHAEELRAAAAESDHDPFLLAGLMYVESGGDRSAVSSAQALGLLQLQLATAVEQARALGLEPPGREELLTDSLLNVRLGAAYLRRLLEACGGDLERALVCYNAGPTKVSRWAEEAGSWRAWRDQREAAGNSSVLRYARDVVRFAERFRERGRVASPEEFPPGRLSLSPPPDTGGFARPPADLPARKGS